VKVNLTQKAQIEPHDLTVRLVSQLFANARLDILLVADAPVDVFVLDHPFVPTLPSGLVAGG